MQAGLSDVIGEVDVEEGKLIALEQVYFDLGLGGILKHDEEANAVEAFAALVSARDVQGGITGADDARGGDVCCVGALVEDRSFPAIVNVGVDALAVDHDVRIGPVLATTCPVDERLYDLGTLGYRN